MRSPALFVGGTLLGVVVSAACGFDLFAPGSSEREIELAGARRKVALLERDRKGADEDRAVWRENLLTAEQRSRQLEGELATARHELRLLAGKTELQASEVEQLNRGLAVAREELAESRERLRQAIDATARCREEAAALVVRYFSSPRPPAEVELARDFLVGGAAVPFKRQLVLELRNFNPELLLSLNAGVGRETSGGAPAGAAGDLEASALTPSSSRGGETPVLRSPER